MHAVIFIGPSGTGKGTQARILSKNFGYHHFEMSKYLREDEGFQYTISSGKRVQCDDVIDVALKSLPLKLPNLIVFDGIPRSVQQAKWLVEHLSVNHYRICVIEVTLDKDLNIRRLLLRGRDDDNPRTIKTKLEEYDDYGRQVSEFLKRHHNCSSYNIVNAERQELDIAKNIDMIIRSEHQLLTKAGCFDSQTFCVSSRH